jgi:hypothetical protein
MIAKPIQSSEATHSKTRLVFAGGTGWRIGSGTDCANYPSKSYAK